MKLNISQIGHGSLFNTSDGNGGLLSTLGNDIEQGINNILNDVTSDIASALGLPDFFKVHVTDFCQGTYSPNATARHAKANVTECSNSALGFHFQPTEYVQQHLPSGVTLDDIHWPSGVTDAEKTLKTISHVMIIFYVIAIALSGLAMITALVSVFFDGRLSALITWLVNVVGFRHHPDFTECADRGLQLAFAALGVASAVATAVIVIAVDRVNKFTDDVGISATKGGKFLAMTWAATAVMLLASFVSIGQCCVGRRRPKRYEKEGY